MPNINRFVRVGQNTPLTCVFQSGFEYNDQARDKFSTATGYATSTSTPHQNTGFGGARHWNPGSGNFAQTQSFPTLREYVAVCAFYPSAGIPTLTMHEPTGDFQTRYLLSATTGAITIRRGSSDLITSASSSFATNTWHWLHTWGKIDNTTGFARARIGSWANLVAEITGVDTQQDASNNYTDSVRLDSTGGVSYFDDLKVYARSMYYTGGTGGAGVPVVGNTLTGVNSGATLVVTHVFDNAGGSGCVFVMDVSGTFESGETIGNGSGWTAVAGNSLANDQTHLWVDEQYIFLSSTSSDVSVNFDTTTGTDHYTEVDDSADTATYVGTNTPNDLDQFGITTVLPPGAIVDTICASVYARLNGVSAVNNIRPGIYDGAANIDLEADSALSGSWEVHDVILTHNPNTGLPFTTTEIGNLNLRITARA